MAHTTTPWYERPKLISLGLSILCFLLYANTLGHDFALDDSIVLTHNELVKQGPSAWGELFSHDSFYGYFGQEKQLVEGGRYRPLSLALFSLEYQLFGDSPFGYHLLNVLWYIGCIWLIYGFWSVVARYRKWSMTIPLVIALVFACHPIHTEVVANIKGRDEILALCGAMGAAWAAWRACFAAGGRRWLWAGISGILLLLGILAKENAITFLAVIPLWLWMFASDFRRSERRADTGSARPRLPVRSLLPPVLALLVAAGSYLAIRSAVLPAGLPDSSPNYELMNNPFLKVEDNQFVPYTSSERLAIVGAIGLKYLELSVLPIRQSHDYYPRAIDARGWTQPQVLLGWGLNIALLVGGLWLGWRRRLAGAGLLTYFIALSVFSNLFINVGTLLSERFLFAPSLGVAIVAAAIFGWAAERWRAPVAWGLLAVWLAFLAVKTVVRNPVWADNFTLFTTDVQQQPRSAKLQNAAGGAKLDAYLRKPEANRRPNDPLLTEAIGHFEEAIAIHPNYQASYQMLGQSLYLRKSYNQALPYLRRAHALSNSSNSTARELLLAALAETAKYLGQQENNLRGADALLDEGLQIDPGYYPLVRLKGIVAGVSGRNLDAISWFQQGTRLKPDNAIAWYDLGTAYYQNGQPEIGQLNIDKAKQLDPNIEQTIRADN